MRYAVVIEKAAGNYSAYVPGLPGCVATGETVEAVEREIQAAIRFHIAGLKGGWVADPPKGKSASGFGHAKCAGHEADVANEIGAGVGGFAMK